MWECILSRTLVTPHQGWDCHHVALEITAEHGRLIFLISVLPPLYLVNSFNIYFNSKMKLTELKSMSALQCISPEVMRQNGFSHFNLYVLTAILGSWIFFLTLKLMIKSVGDQIFLRVLKSDTVSYPFCFCFRGLCFYDELIPILKFTD